MFVPVGTEEPVPRRRFPVVTASIVALNIIVFLFELSILLTGGEDALSAFFMSYGVVPAAITSGQSIGIPYYLTPFTSMFVHAGIAHLGFNMLYLSAFGDNVEDRLGRLHYVIFYLLSGLAAALAQIAVNPASQVPSVGASGAIAGVLAGYLLFFPTGIVRMLIFLGPFITITRVSAMLFIIFWFFMQLFIGVASLGVMTEQTGGVAYWAHIGGFTAGLVLAQFYKWLKPEGG
ncbi:MAG: rhomboid family intramembrane serine protease [Candidatus Methanoperedens sp.]|nr:rhomboid family intramembrane serine protease [Candidatus Methanoperedens sp.]